MGKKQFVIPRVFLTGAEIGEGGNGSLIGPVPTGGSGLDAITPIPCRYEEWLESRWAGDYDNAPGVDFNDYTRWWLVNGFGSEAWNSFNPGVAWNDEWIR